jgi:hypothetical protein
MGIGRIKQRNEKSDSISPRCQTTAISVPFLTPQKTAFSLRFCGCMREAVESSEEISAVVGKTQRSFFAVQSYEAKK